MNKPDYFPVASAAVAACKGAVLVMQDPNHFSMQIKLQGFQPIIADKVIIQKDFFTCKINKKMPDGKILTFCAKAVKSEQDGIWLTFGEQIRRDRIGYLGFGKPAIEPQVLGFLLSELVKTKTNSVHIVLTVENADNKITIDDERRNCMLYPIKMESVFKEMIWGGNKLKKVFGKKIPNDKIGESWEVSCHKDGISKAANGEYAGMKLTELVKTLKTDLTGKDGNTFSLFYKIIDANDKLSIQVHPDDAYAQKHENSPFGKTEMWYIIDAEPGAKIGYGFNCDMTKEEVKKAIEDGNLEQFINYIEVKPGEGYFIPAGLVHCLCEGVLVGEIQQNSNITYRIYDYNRSYHGQKRELHADKALEVANLKKTDIVSGKTDGVLAECDYFTCEKIRLDGQVSDETNGAYHILFFAEGKGEISCEAGVFSFTAGDTFILPAKLGAYVVKGKGIYTKNYIK